jgi:putative sigma-54 modulation protein
MKIELSGHHVDITDGIKEAVNTKFQKIQNHYPDIDTLSVIVTVERKEQKIEVSTNYLGTVVSVHASDSELYAAIASAVKKMESALSHRKGAVKAGRHEKPELIQEPDMDEAVGQ